MKKYEGEGRLVEVDESKWRPVEADDSGLKQMKVIEVDEARGR